jgi:hypothetical protein
MDLFEHAAASRFVPNCGFLSDVWNDKGKKCHPERHRWICSRGHRREERINQIKSLARMIAEL